MKAVASFIELEKFVSIQTDLEEVVEPNDDKECIFQCLLNPQAIQEFRKKVYVAFIKVKSKFDIRNLFMGV